MSYQGVQRHAIKYEVRQLSGTPIDQAVEQRHKGGGFARFMSSVGRIFAGIAAPLAFIFPPAGLAAAAAYGISKTGDILQASRANKLMQQGMGAPQMNQMFIPGLTDTATGFAQETSYVSPAQNAHQQQSMHILAARNDMTMDTVKYI